MHNRNFSTWLTPTILIGLGCLTVICLAGVVFFGAAFFLGIAAPFGSVPAPVGTNSPTAAQIDLCRSALAIRDEAVVDVEWFYYQEGFLDDSLRCRLTTRAAALSDVFDESRVDLSRLDEQHEVAPGRFLMLEVSEPEPGLFLIVGSWFET